MRLGNARALSASRAPQAPLHAVKPPRPGGARPAPPLPPRASRRLPGASASPSPSPPRPERRSPTRRGPAPPSAGVPPGSGGAPGTSGNDPLTNFDPALLSDLAARMAPLIAVATSKHPGMAAGKKDGAVPLQKSLESALVRELGAWTAAMAATAAAAEAAAGGKAPAAPGTPRPKAAAPAARAPSADPSAWGSGSFDAGEAPAVAPASAAWAGPACGRICTPVAGLAHALLLPCPATDAEDSTTFSAAANPVARSPATAAAILLRRGARGVLRGLLALIAACGATGHRPGVSVWLLEVLRETAPRLGLLEAGVVLATLHARFEGRPDLLRTAAAVLFPSQTERLRCLLLHYVLLPQLASAGLPALPADALATACVAAATAPSTGGKTLAASLGPGGPRPVSSVALEQQETDGPITAATAPAPLIASPAAPLFMGLDPVGGFTPLTKIILACADAADGGLARDGTVNTEAAVAQPLGQISWSAIRELHPMAPGALLLAERLAAAADDAAVAPGGKPWPADRAARAARAAREALPLRLLLRAWGELAGGGENREAGGVGALVGRALWQVSYHYGQLTQQGGGKAAKSTEAVLNRYVDAASKVLLSLGPDEFGPAAVKLMGVAGDAGAAGASPAAAELCSRALASAAERADEQRMVSLLHAAPLPVSAWEHAWAVFLSPTRGAFCSAPKGLAAALMAVADCPAGPGAARERLATAWSDLLSGMHRLIPGGGPTADDALGLDQMLTDALRGSTLEAGATHVAALAAARSGSGVAPERLTQLMGGALVSLEREAAFVGAPQRHAIAVGAVAWAAALRELTLLHPPLAAAPPALRVLAAAAAALPGDALPAFLPAAADLAAADCVGATDALELLHACAAARRDASGLQLLMRRLAAELPPAHAVAMLAAIPHRMSPATLDAVRAAAGLRPLENSSAPTAAPFTPSDAGLTAAFSSDDAAVAETNDNDSAPQLPPLLPPEFAAREAARLCAQLLSVSGPALRAAHVAIPALAREFGAHEASSSAAAAFARAAAEELPTLPADRAALGLVLLQPVLSASGGLRDAARAVAAIHGRSQTVAALEGVWFDGGLPEGGGVSDGPVFASDGGVWGDGDVISLEAVHDVIWSLE